LLISKHFMTCATGAAAGACWAAAHCCCCHSACRTFNRAKHQWLSTLNLRHACTLLAACCVQRQQHRLDWLPWYSAMVSMLCVQLPGECCRLL
jgi:hypothetical protein